MNIMFFCQKNYVYFESNGFQVGREREEGGGSKLRKSNFIYPLLEVCVTLCVRRILFKDDNQFSNLP